jgi:hypothetical protein
MICRWVRAITAVASMFNQPRGGSPSIHSSIHPSRPNLQAVHRDVRARDGGDVVGPVPASARARDARIPLHRTGHQPAWLPDPAGPSSHMECSGPRSNPWTMMHGSQSLLRGGYTVHRWCATTRWHACSASGPTSCRSMCLPRGGGGGSPGQDQATTSRGCRATSALLSTAGQWSRRFVLTY